MVYIDGAVRRQFDDAVKRQLRNFDSKAFMLSTRRGPDYNYHTNVRNAKVHMIRESFYLALYLLDRNNDGDLDTASHIVERLLKLQDLNPESPTYGIWPYYAEESIAEMSAPDWNWADFCGKGLIQILVDYQERLSAVLVADMKLSVQAAAESIAKRDVPPSYTNIAIMGTYVTLLAGEILDHEELFRYGSHKLKSIHEYHLYHGEFTEYNSPTYTLVAIEDLSLMLRHIRDDTCRSMIEELNFMGWSAVAKHFHWPTRQWAGPHSRCYATLQNKELLSFIQLAAGGSVRLLEEAELEIQSGWPRVGLQCPELLLPYFSDNQPVRYEEKTIFKGEPSLRATSYITPHYTLGTFNHSDLWNQRRPLIAYWGDTGSSSYMRLRCMHDDYDFSSALLHTCQHRNLVLGIAHFCTDHGDKHFSLDPMDGKMELSYVSFRFEFGGDIQQIHVPESIEKGKPFIIHSPYVKIGMVVREMAFGEHPVKIKVKEENGLLQLDIVLYEGERSVLNLADMEEALAAFGLVVENTELEDERILSQLSDIISNKQEGRVSVAYQNEFIRLRLSAPSTALPYLEAMDGDEIFKESFIRPSGHVWTVKSANGVPVEGE